MFLLTGGLDTGSDHNLTDVIAACQSAGTTVYSLRDAEHSSLIPASRTEAMVYSYLSEKPDLSRISRETGGLAFDRATTKLPEVLDRIQFDLRNQYVLAFTPATAHSARSFHKLQVKA